MDPKYDKIIRLVKSPLEFAKTSEGKYIVWWGIVLVILGCVYIRAHWNVPGSIDRKLSKEDITTVTSLLNDTTMQSEFTPVQLDSIKKENALAFIFNRLNPKDEDSRIALQRQVAHLNTPTFISVLPSISMSSGYYFWLNNDWKYMEIIFWSIFGVIANLLYKSSDAVAQGIFDRRAELTLYTAKICYAPLISLVIIFSYSTLSDSNEVHFDNTSLELLVFSFILGFFSSRAIELLNKVKDVLLPGGKGEELQPTAGFTGKVEPPAGTSAINLEETEITLRPLKAGEQEQTAYADEEGNFSFGGIKPGEYSIKAKLADEGLGTFSAGVEKKSVTKTGLAEPEVLILRKES